MQLASSVLSRARHVSKLARAPVPTSHTVIPSATTTSARLGFSKARVSTASSLVDCSASLARPVRVWEPISQRTGCVVRLRKSAQSMARFSA